MMENGNFQMDWSELDEQYREYCYRCQTQGVPAKDFGDWLMTDSSEDKPTAQ